MTWMKYPVLAAAITAAGCGFLLVPPTTYAVTDTGHAEAIVSDHGNGGVHLDHGDHIDPEPDEIKETYRSDSYALPAWRPYAAFIEYTTSFVNSFREDPRQSQGFLTVS